MFKLHKFPFLFGKSTLGAAENVLKDRPEKGEIANVEGIYLTWLV